MNTEVCDLSLFDGSKFLGKIRKDKFIESLLEIINKLTTKNEELEEVMRALSHDLKSPLANIEGLGNLLKDTDDEKEREKYLYYLGTTAKTGLDLVTSTLEFFKADKKDDQTKPEKIDAVKLVEKVIDLHKALAIGKKIKVELNLASEPCPISFNKVQFQRVVSNLTSNAIKFSKKEGKVTITVKSEKDIVQIDVKDDGIGIPEKVHSEIFKPYTSAKRSGTNKESSSGLGLAISKKFVQNAGGTISFESQ